MVMSVCIVYPDVFEMYQIYKVKVWNENKN